MAIFTFKDPAENWNGLNCMPISIPASWQPVKPDGDHSLPAPALATVPPLDQLHLDRLSRGDSSAVWDLWTEHRSSVFQLCLVRLGGRHADAEDACSLVMQNMRTALPKEAATMRNLKAWLNRLAVNVCVDIQRLDKRRGQGSYASQAKNPDEELAQLVAADRTGPDQNLLYGELGSAINRAIAGLPARLGEAARSYFLEDCSYVEIAESLQTSNANVRKRIQEARHLLKAVLREYREAGDLPTTRTFATPPHELPTPGLSMTTTSA